MKKALLLLFGLVALPPALLVGGFYAWENGNGALAWWGAERALRAVGEPLAAEDIRPAPLPDADNMAAAPIFQQLAALHNPRRAALYQVQLPPVPPETIRSAGSELIALARRFDPAFSGDANAAAVVVLAGRAPMDPVLTAVGEAAARPGAAWPDLPDEKFDAHARRLEPLRNTAAVLAARASAAVAAREPSRALADVALIVRLAGRASAPPSLATDLASHAMLGEAVAIVRSGLNAGAWSDEDLDRLEALLAPVAALDDFRSAVRGERVRFLTSADEVHARAEALFTFVDFRTPAAAWLTSVACRLAWALRPSGWLARDRARYAIETQRWIDFVIHNRFVRPWALAEWNARTRRFQRDAFEFFKTPLSGLTLPMFPNTARSAAYAQTSVDLARIALAIERFRRTHGRPPTALDELAPAWLPGVPRDVVGGGPYFYRPADDGYLLYGRGWNAVDDGGETGSPNPLLGPSTADDWIWRGRYGPGGNASSGRPPSSATRAASAPVNPAL